MRIVVPLIALTAVLAGCGSDRSASMPAAPAAPAQVASAAPSAAAQSFSEGGVFTPYYGEEVYDGRIYVFGSKVAHEKFKETHEADVVNTKTLIRRGPNKETVVVQTDKDQPQQYDRIWKQFCDRNHLS